MPSDFDAYCDIVLFGIPVVVEADDRDILTALSAAFAPWRDAAGSVDEEPIYVVIETRSGPLPGEVSASVLDGCLLAVQDGIRIEADGKTRRGRCIGARLPGDSDAWQNALETALLFLAAQAGRTPLHASAIMMGGRAVVLAGPSGAGKSTLALAADRAGFAVLSDDTIYVQTMPALRIWSFARAIHVFEKDTPPGNRLVMRFRAGRWKRRLPMTSPCHHADAAVLCVLEKGHAVALAQMDAGEASARITARPESGYDFYGERLLHAAQAVARGGAWLLTLSSDPDDAIAVLVEMFSGGASHPDLVSEAAGDPRI